MFRLIFTFMLFYVLWKMLKKIFQPRQRPFSDFGPTPRPETAPKFSAGSARTDSMQACAFCQTYIPSRLAFTKKNLYFCNRECHESYLKTS